MKRYDENMCEVEYGDWTIYEEAQALLAEKDAEIDRLNAGWQEANIASLNTAHQLSICEEQLESSNELLRASNEALVAAEARVEYLGGLLDHNKLVYYGDNLTALANHDAALRAEVRKATLVEVKDRINAEPIEVVGNSAETEEQILRLIDRMAAQISEEK